MMIPMKASIGPYDNLAFRIRNHLFHRRRPQKVDLQNIPVIINNYNRLECLQLQLAWISAAGLRNVYIIDNASNYRPLLEFYKTTKYKVLRLNRNIGFEALWKTIIFQRFRHSYYIYTDPDIVPDPGCGLDAVIFFYQLLQQYPHVQKVGFGLQINDIPDHYPLQQKVISWEQKFWQYEIEKDVYDAPIDTTFALYRPGARGGSELPAFRTGGRFTAKHTSWYMNPEKLTTEERDYLAQANGSSSWAAEWMGRERNTRY
jgi:hypothetical protein